MRKRRRTAGVLRIESIRRTPASVSDTRIQQQTHVGAYRHLGEQFGLPSCQPPPLHALPVLFPAEICSRCDESFAAVLCTRPCNSGDRIPATQCAAVDRCGSCGRTQDAPAGGALQTTHMQLDSIRPPTNHLTRPPCRCACVVQE